MAQELGRIDRPFVEQYEDKRKLLLVPLVPRPPDQAQECLLILRRYWVQMQSQVATLESKLGQLQHFYHETLTEGGTQGLQRLESIDQQSYNFVRSKCQAGATLEATEDEELLAEVLDLQRCLMLPFYSDEVARRLHEWFAESSRKRYAHISKQIDETLKEKEVGLLLISERHQVQFPADVEVFFVAPPALDEFRRCLEEWLTQQQKAPTEMGEDQQESP